jgi:hypothetical protein
MKVYLIPRHFNKVIATEAQICCGGESTVKVERNSKGKLHILYYGKGEWFKTEAEARVAMDRLIEIKKQELLK